VSWLKMMKVVMGVGDIEGRRECQNNWSVADINSVNKKDINCGTLQISIV